MQYSLTYNSYNNWTLPLNLAIGFHILVAVSIVVLPDLLKPRPKFEDIYTVNLVNVSETIAQPEPESAPSPEPIKPVETKKAIAIADPVKPLEPLKPVKPVSIKPLKRKVKKKITPKKDPEKLQELQRKRIAEALRAEQEAARQAQIAAEEAARQQRLLEADYRRAQTQASKLSQTQRPKRGGTSGGAVASGAEAVYMANIRNRVIQFWALPEFKNWDPAIETVVALRISPSGRVTRQVFEKESSDPTFNQFVRKAIQDAKPFPPMPRALKNKSYEFVLRFSPQGIKI